MFEDSIKNALNYAKNLLIKV